MMRFTKRWLLTSLLAALFLCSAFAAILTTAMTSGRSKRVALAAAATTNIASGVHASGDKLLDGNGNVVRLHGVNVSGTEYACINGYGFFDSVTPDQAFVDRLKAEGVSSVRVPLNEDCWLAINGSPAAYSGANYQNAISSWVNLLVANNIVPILDLQWNAPGTQKATGTQPMPDADHSSTFWQQVAAAYAGRPGVAFDLLNEPRPSSWNCWKNGGSACSVGYAAVGFQSLVNTVRAAGANNLILLGCLDYSNTCNGYSSYWQSYVPSDPAHNLAASFHVYLGNPCVTTTCWDNGLKPILAAGYPVVDGEFGAYKYDGTSYSENFGTTLLNWFDANCVSGYNAWTWDDWGAWSASSAESMIQSSNGGTLSTWGAFVKNQYAARTGACGEGAGGGGTSPTNPTPTPTTPTNPPTPTSPPSTSCVQAVSNVSESDSPDAVQPGQTITFSMSYTQACAGNMTVAWDIFDQSGHLVHQVALVNISGVASKNTKTASYTIPSTMASGTYNITVGVWSANWSTNFAFINKLGTLAVGSPSVNISTVPCTVTLNGTQQTGVCSGTFTPKP
jgi:endoglucanase